jgi:hypothetical protein
MNPDINPAGTSTVPATPVAPVAPAAPTASPAPQAKQRPARTFKKQQQPAPTQGQATFVKR